MASSALITSVDLDASQIAFCIDRIVIDVTDSVDLKVAEVDLDVEILEADMIAVDVACVCIDSDICDIAVI